MTVDDAPPCPLQAHLIAALWQQGAALQMLELSSLQQEAVLVQALTTVIWLVGRCGHFGAQGLYLLPKWVEEITAMPDQEVFLDAKPVPDG